MSFAENLVAEMQPRPNSCTICTWLATLSAEDRAAFHDFRSTIAAGRASMAQLWRACSSSGLPMKYKRFMEHYRKDCHVTQ